MRPRRNGLHAFLDLPTPLTIAHGGGAEEAPESTFEASARPWGWDIAVPRLFKGALEVRARTINEEMKLAAAHAIAHVIPDGELHPDYMIPSVFNRRVAESVAEVVAGAAVASGVARRRRGPRARPRTPLKAMR